MLANIRSFHNPTRAQGRGARSYDRPQVDQPRRWLYTEGVPKELSGRRVFLASPGGLDTERACLRQTIAAFNESFAFDNEVAFVSCGWEPIAGTVQRPQAAINPMLRQCDFMVLLLSDRWGSPPGGGTSFEIGRASCRERVSLVV